MSYIEAAGLRFTIATLPIEIVRSRCGHNNFCHYIIVLLLLDMFCVALVIVFAASDANTYCESN